MDENLIKEVDTFAYDFLKESILVSIIIVASSRIDELLGAMLAKYFLEKTSKQKDNDELFDGDNPLGTFSSRIKIAYRLGLISKSFFNILETVRKIRNKSAHQAFYNKGKEEASIKSYIRDLNNMVQRREAYELVKERYFREDVKDEHADLRCSYLAICIILQILIYKIEKLNPNETLIIISER